MNFDIDTVEISEKNDGCRKKQKKKNKRERAKELRYGFHLQNLIDDFERPCSHNSKGLNCNQITEEDILLARKKFFHKPNKHIQDVKLSNFLQVLSPKRRCEKYKPTARVQKQSVRVKYKLRKVDGTLVNVCNKFFLRCFNITTRRVLTIARHVKEGNELKERRGGDRKLKKNEDKKRRVMNFIGKLRARESHYNRTKSKRLYLPSELNIKKLCAMYNAKNSDRTVKYGYFYKIFCNNFNIGFGSPASDVCSLCFSLKSKIQQYKAENKPIVSIMTNLRIHKLRAQQFTKFMKEDDINTISYCFDMEQVQPLPKLPIGESFYLRQLSFYNLCATDLHCKNPIFYTWTENEASRGANEVASSIGDFLSELEIPENCKHLRFFADGCAGQNKNAFVIHAMCMWLYHDAPKNLDNITVIFPVRGHSFMPADRIFGQVEQKYRKHSVIPMREDYEKLLEEVGKVRRIGRDWTLYNVKEMSQENCKKLTGIRDMKRIFIKRVENRKSQKKDILVKMEINYRNDDTSKKFESIMKRGKKISDIKINTLPLINQIKPKKLIDVKKLLNIYDKEWEKNETFEFYKQILGSQVVIDEEMIGDGEDTNSDEEHGAEEDMECNCMEDDCGVRI